MKKMKNFLLLILSAALIISCNNTSITENSNGEPDDPHTSTEWEKTTQNN